MSTQTLETSRPLNLLVLYDGGSVPVSTTRDYLKSFRLFSRHRVYYAHAVFEAPLRFSLSLFDAVLIHYSVRMPMRHHLSSAFFRALQKYQGLKVLFLQDEYEHTRLTCERITQLGIDVVFTCVPPRHTARVFAGVPEHVEFFPTLTGYLPLDWDSSQSSIRPLQQRPFLIGYRGRPLAYHYGRLAHEKVQIARTMRVVCQVHNLPHDIEWTEQTRIYGPGWSNFIQNCQTMLGTESACNVFDHDGTLRTRMREALRRCPEMSFEEAYDRFLQGREVDGMMNQVSPRVFEAVASRTGLILFEGAYSGVVRPDEHYIPLRKDFRNIDEVLARVQDRRQLQAMIDRAHDHVVGSGLYTYQRLIARVDQVLGPRIERSVRARSEDRAAPEAIEKELARLVELGSLDRQPVPKAPPARTVELLRIGQLALAEPRRSLPRLGAIAWDLLVRLIWIAPLRCLQQTALALVKMVHLLPELLGNPLLRRALRQERGLAVELARLVILRQARLADPHTLGFELLSRLQSGPDGLKLLFLSMPLDLADKVARDPAGDGLALEQSLRSGKLRAIIWDHSALGERIRYPFQGNFAAPFLLGPQGAYRFEKLTELTRRQPELVLALLTWALALPEQDQDLPCWPLDAAEAAKPERRNEPCVELPQSWT
jgi:hypothetical protein